MDSTLWKAIVGMALQAIKRYLNAHQNLYTLYHTTED